MSRPSEDLIKVLDRLEDEEMRLLAWGLVDGGFDEKELIEFIDRLNDEDDIDVDPHEALDELETLGLIGEYDGFPGRVFRTRMAETVRLLAMLRQLFPGKPWATSPRLVADYRLKIKPRRFPFRNIEPAEVVTHLSSEVQLDDQQQRAITTLLSSTPGPERPLARFQVEATNRILTSLQRGTSAGIVVSAGTGSGKTLAFYLPALAHLATQSRTPHWAKALAVYPRNELLKDQLRTALQETRRLAAGGLPQLRLGAFFGPVPHRGTVWMLEKSFKWQKRGAGFVCPFLICLDDTCGGLLLWRNEDLEKSQERLTCQSCGDTVEPTELALTRDGQRTAPPDIVFTSTESLNRAMSDSTSAHVFGIGADRPPRMLLLDEIHTYEGVSGAQTALLIRRWRHQIRGPVTMVGLSATLDDGEAFFARLTGIKDGLVSLVEPAETDLDARGKEYQLALRGDPASQTALLSTTIQTAMLLRRVLDTAPTGKSGGTYGSRAFVFTDNLDVTNRLYHQLRDAEGKTPYMQKRGSLAALRAAGEDDQRKARDRDGQHWGLPESLGHELRPELGLEIGRTSSQDTGVDTEADLIVATASLEVGFDDPTVGAILQHKAPHDAAQFIQREGRAGRPVTMRPWTVVVLSDYGRDRLAYQGYDLLFDPRLPRRTLPVSNRYVLRMQATYAFMDWMRAELARRGAPAGSVWAEFAAPAGEWTQYEVPKTERRQALELDIVNRLLDDPAEQTRLADHLQRSLQVSDDEALALLWEPPRALLTAVIPTLARRLESHWLRSAPPPTATKDLMVRDSPLPDFIPKNLFSDLSLPEVAIHVPSQQNPQAERVLQAMREFAPGKVTYRYALGGHRGRLWIEVPAAGALDLSGFCSSYSELGDFDFLDDAGQPQSVRVVRPWEYRPTAPPDNVMDSSNGRLAWRTQILPDGAPVQGDVPDPSPWTEVVDGVSFFVQNRRSMAIVRRFALSSRAEIVTRSGSQRQTIGFSDGADPVALGYVLDVDAMMLRCRIPQTLEQFGIAEDGPKLRALRSTYFAHCLHEDETLEQLTNVFQRDWLIQLYLSALVANALANGSSLEAARGALRAGGDRAVLEVLDVIFQSVGRGELDTDTEESVDRERAKLHDTLERLLDEPVVVAALQRHVEVLWAEPDAEWLPWLQGRYQATLGAALIDAIQALCPEFDVEDLVLDLQPGPRPGSPSLPPDQREIWISESVVGGGGLVEELLLRYAEDPRRFFRLVENALGPSDFELVDSELTRYLDLVADDEQLAEAAGAVRRASRHDQRATAWQQLIDQLVDRGNFVSHSVTAALTTRLLRPGSRPEVDQAMREVISRWNAQEERLGIEIDARVFAFHQSDDEKTGKLLQRLVAGSAAGSDRQWRFGVLLSLLWPRGSSVRAEALAAWSPYADIPATERTLVLDQLASGVSSVDIADEDWRDQTDTALRREGSVVLRGRRDDRARLRAAVTDVLGRPLHLDYLEVNPRIAGTRRTADGLELQLELAEITQ